MNVLKTNFVLPTMCPTQKMQFHHSASPLKTLIDNNVLPPKNSPRSFTNPNFFHAERGPSNNRNDQGTPEQANMKTTIEISPSSRKRSRKSKHSKSPEKHNRNRRIINEMMEVSSDSTDGSFGIPDEGMEESHPESLKLSDLIFVPDNVSPVPMTACFALSISPPKTRQRQISTTESEDSFIVFESGTDEECDFSDDDQCSEIEEESDACDEVDAATDSDSPSSVVPSKKVRFAKDLCEVHPMIKWSYAYQAARKGPWEVYARDRVRFKSRIRMIGDKIGHCLEPEHRQKVYDQRFDETMDV